MALFTASGLTYPEAATLIKVLRSKGIEANITSGAVAIYPEPNQITEAKEICSANGASFKAGYSEHQESILMTTTQGYNELERGTNNANALYKEWSNVQP